MRKSQIRFSLFLLAFVACSCSVEMEQPINTPGVPPTPVLSSTSLFPVTQVPVTWSHLQLTGKLVYLSSAMEGDQLTSMIQRLDLVTGEVETIFRMPTAWIYYATISPDAKTLAMSYIPPRQSNLPSNRSLYMLSLDDPSVVQPLVTPPTADDHYTQIEWSAHGTYLVYVHYNSQIRPKGQLDPVYNLFRVDPAGGQAQKIADHTFWPRISFDSSKLVFVYVDPETARNELFVSEADGSNVHQVVLSGAQIPEIIDAPIFLPDGQTLLFSAPEPSPSYPLNFFERWMGVRVAKAHDVPSDWWSVPVTGGVPTRLTHLQTINLFASFSPDQRHIASLSGEGIFVMGTDGSNLTQLVPDPGVHGTVSWIP